jgi:hypothetical protein
MNLTIKMITIVNTNCPNCNCIIEHIVLNMKLINSELNFCSKDCALEYYSQRRILELRRKKIDKIRNGI